MIPSPAEKGFVPKPSAAGEIFYHFILENCKNDEIPPPPDRYCIGETEKVRK